MMYKCKLGWKVLDFSYLIVTVTVNLTCCAFDSVVPETLSTLAEQTDGIKGKSVGSGERILCDRLILLELI